MTQKILLIEDDEFIRDIYHNEPTKNGFLVDGVRTGKEGFELGAQGYLMKLSYTPDQIVQEIKTVLEGGSIKK